MVTTDPPPFVAVQEDGSAVEVDLSRPGAYGDFAFTVHRAGARRAEHFYAYHTGEAAIFCAVLATLAARQPAATALADIERIRCEVTARTQGLDVMTRAENTFDDVLANLEVLVRDRKTGDACKHTANAAGSDTLVVTPTPIGLTLVLRRETEEETFERAVTVQTGDLWRFAAAMVAQLLVPRGQLVATFHHGIRACPRELRSGRRGPGLLNLS
ncbi:MAG: hypothetical protein DLM57_10375 [Pseudonocardiales bacterium]|nr:MAG: hypothetical protein DLM57_10375 [Pseudonocardiales bacterium]